MAERLIPGGVYLNETGTAQRLIPGVGYVNETVSAGGGLNVSASLGTATADGFVAGVDQQNAIASLFGTAAAAGFAANVNQQTDIAALFGSATASGGAANIDRQTGIAAGIGTATASGFDADVATGSSSQINATLGAAIADGFMASIDQQRSVSAFLGAAGADGFTATIQTVFPSVGRPTSDVSNSGWVPSSGVSLYDMLNEATPGDLDYISASAAGAVCTMALNLTQYPGAASQQLSIRAASSTGNGLTVVLKDGAATIATRTLTLTPDYALHTITLTAGEIAAITSGSLTVEMTSV